MSFLDGFFVSYVPKIGAALSLAGGVLTTMGQPLWGTVLLSIGAGLTGLSSRQDGKTSEDVGIKDPEVIIKVEPPIIVREKLHSSAKDRRG